MALSDEQVAQISRDVIDDVLSLHSGSEALAVSSGPQEAYLLGWWRAVTRQAAAVVAPADASLGCESIPLLRGMVEHSILVALIIEKPTLWRTLERARNKRAGSILERLETRGIPAWEELKAYKALLERETGAEVPEDDWLSSFTNQADELGNRGDVAYLRYQYLTHLSHAGVESALNSYAPDGSYTDPSFDSPFTEAVAAMILLEVAADYNRLLPSRPWNDRLNVAGLRFSPVQDVLAGMPFVVPPITHS